MVRNYNKDGNKNLENYDSKVLTYMYIWVSFGLWLVKID